jgi:hypothetical protein
MSPRSSNAKRFFRLSTASGTGGVAPTALLARMSALTTSGWSRASWRPIRPPHRVAEDEGAIDGQRLQELIQVFPQHPQPHLRFRELGLTEAPHVIRKDPEALRQDGHLLVPHVEVVAGAVDQRQAFPLPD